MGRSGLDGVSPCRRARPADMLSHHMRRTSSTTFQSLLFIFEVRVRECDPTPIDPSMATTGTALSSTAPHVQSDAKSLNTHVLAYPDALPYYDTEIDHVRGLRETVEQAIEEEKQQLPYAPQDLLPPAHVPWSDKPAWTADWERAKRGESMHAIDTTRYQLPAPSGGAETSEEAWAHALRNAETQLAYMDAR